LGIPYLRFGVCTQKVEIELPCSDHEGIRVEDARSPTELDWNVENYVAAFLSRDPYSVVLDVEALAGLTRKEYVGCWLTHSTLPVTLVAGLLQRKMFTDCALEVSNAFCHSLTEENCRVREWARVDHDVPEWAFDGKDEDWVDKAKHSLHLWKLGPAADFNTDDSCEAPGIVFDLDECTASFQGDYTDTVSLWDMYQSGAGYNALLDFFNKSRGSYRLPLRPRRHTPRKFNIRQRY
jgi:hypothetical protein